VSTQEISLQYSIRFPRLPFLLINIIGHIGTGKTTLAFYLWRRWKWVTLSKYVGNIYFQYDRSKVSEFWEAIKNYKKERAWVVVDDISFAIGQKDREFLHTLTKLRHFNPRVKRWVVVTIMHYSRATLPFLRQAGVKILTSLTDPEEIEALRWSFTTSALWDYYRVYTECPECHYILVNWMGKIGISHFNKPKRNTCWEIVVNGNPCVG